MEWSAAESKSIRENGPHQARPCTTQHGYPLTKVAKEEKSITPKASHKEQEDSNLGGEEPKVMGMSGEGANAASAPRDNRPLPMKPAQVDMEESDDNLFSTDEELDEEQNNCSKSVVQGKILSTPTKSGREKKEEAGCKLQKP